jgi:hypothetical protein
VVKPDLDLDDEFETSPEPPAKPEFAKPVKEVEIDADGIGAMSEFERRLREIDDI